ncbi:neutral/alkaline non-lysosomal ceramidase N-terminal domain-containing protein [Saccharopolyspora spinosa]|uniref:neutral/alkaline non-lysosomal ceramidase N-terminal domain-containing protein n=1 Tax=Saccharopolyspora spinosa TaxID=60894 RepID=UPI003748EEE6
MTVARRQVLAATAAVPLAVSALRGASAAADPTRAYLVGPGIADVTGPAAENGMMGYSMPQQQTAGIHLRTLARAFIVVSATSGSCS